MILQGGPVRVVSRVITPISRVINTVAHLFSTIYRGEITTFITAVPGPPIVGMAAKVETPRS